MLNYRRVVLICTVLVWSGKMWWDYPLHDFHGIIIRQKILLTNVREIYPIGFIIIYLG